MPLDAFTVYLTLTDQQTGETRNLLLETVSGLENEFKLNAGFRWENTSDNVIVQSENGSTTVCGRVDAYFYQPLQYEANKMRCYPVGARIILRQGKTELKSASFSTPEPDDTMGRYQAKCTVDWTVDAPPEQLQLVTEYTDNYGRIKQFAKDLVDAAADTTVIN